MTLSRRDLHAALLGSAFAMSMGRELAFAAEAEQPEILRRVDPQLREGALQVMASPLPAWSREAVIAIRAKIPPASPPLPAPAPQVELRTAPGSAGQPEVKVQLIGARATVALRPAVLHIHGGGFILGRVEDVTPMCQTISSELDCVVVNVDYRLSPETPFPGPVEDCYAALVWLHRNAEALGVDRTRIAVMGESAGGGLAAMVAIMARDRGEVRLCYQVLIYPMLDDRTGSSRRVPAFIGVIGWNEAGNRFGWSSFLGAAAGGATAPHGAVPARLEDLRGLAPAFIGVGAIDLFVDEDLNYARRLVAAGVPTQFHLTPGAYHGFDFIAPQARVSKEFTAAWKSGLGAAFSAA